MSIFIEQQDRGAINMAGPEIIGYENWLKAYDDKSPLYCGNNESL